MKDYILTNVKLLVDGKLEEGKIGVVAGRVEEGAACPKHAAEIDCAGLAALPAMIDNHVHFREPGAEQKEDFASGSAAAAHGGAGTVLEVQNSLPLLTSPERLRAKREIIARKSCVNVGLYASATEETLSFIDEMAASTAGLKLFMAPSHGDEGYGSAEGMRPFFSTCARLGCLLIVHAEDGRVIREASRKYDATRPEDFSRIRPAAAEIAAVETAIALAGECGTRLHIFHVSTAGAVDLIVDARREGLDVTASTCPHYLFFCDEDFSAGGALLKCFPSIKSRFNRDRIFGALREGVIEIVSTDHAPHEPDEKALPFAESPAGISSSDLFLPLMTTLAGRGEFTLDEVVGFCARNPARIHGLVDAGEIASGRAADIVLIDLKKRWTVRSGDFLSKASLSPYNGMELQGRVAATLVGGKAAYVDGTGPLRELSGRI
jgi:dihydroorotase